MLKSELINALRKTVGCKMPLIYKADPGVNRGEAKLHYEDILKVKTLNLNNWSPVK